MSRRVEPLYVTGSCSEELFEKVNCGFASQVYARFAAHKYGVDVCTIDAFDKYWVKKQLLDLNLIYDENLCCTIACIAPCGVVASIVSYRSSSCAKPSTPSAVIVIPEITCTAPTIPVAIISFQSLN